LCAYYFCKLIGKLYAFFAASGVQLAQTNHFHYSRAAFSSQLKPKVGNILAKAAKIQRSELTEPVIRIFRVAIKHTINNSEGPGNQGRMVTRGYHSALSIPS
jgi:hypothetical protein